MNNTKKLIALAATAALTLSLAACSNGNSSSTENSSSDAASTVIRVGASPSPHAEILEFAKDQLAEKGYTLEIVEFTDYVMPNVALTEGDRDATLSPAHSLPHQLQRKQRDRSGFCLQGTFRAHGPLIPRP